MDNELKLPANFDYPEEDEKAQEYLRLTLAMLTRFKLMPNPLNYMFCYEHVSGRNQELSTLIEKVLKENKGLSREATIELFSRFILSDDQQALEEQRNKLDKVMTEALSGVGESADKASLSSTLLGSCSEKLNESSDLNEIRQVVGEIVTETRTMAQNGQRLNEMLSEMRNEMESLREELTRSRKQANTDALTGLLNRRGFDLKLEQIMEEATTSRTSLSLLIIDIDNFKHVNDTHGHLVGDKVIRFVGVQLSKTVKGRDVVARIGGEEYAVLLPETRIDQARIVAEAIRVVIEKSHLKRMDTNEPIGTVTVSIGVTNYKFTENGEAFIKRADEALYMSKNAGRNRVTLQF